MHHVWLAPVLVREFDSMAVLKPVGATGFARMGMGPAPLATSVEESHLFQLIFAMSGWLSRFYDFACSSGMLGSNACLPLVSRQDSTHLSRLGRVWLRS